jgi:hypothetical protein
MVYRKRKFTEVDGAYLLEATEVFDRALTKAQANAPFGSEIFKAIETAWGAMRQVQITLTGDPEYGRMPVHSTHNNPPPKQLKLRTWDTIPLWKEQAAKK